MDNSNPEATESPDRPPVIIIGAGLAGLACARVLHAAGERCLLLEAGDAAGGRVRTDEFEGFLLDRGFQVLLTAYPEAQAVLDYDALDLKSFQPGALIRSEGHFHHFADPWRQPGRLLQTAFSPVGTFADKLRIGRLRSRSRRGTLDSVFKRPEQSTRDMLKESGFSDRIVERFFKPFLGGVFLEPELTTSSRMLEFVFRHFSEGDAAVPAKGMQAIPDQLAAGLPEDGFRFRTPVAELTDDAVELDGGERIPHRGVVVATDGTTAGRLLDEVIAPSQPRTACCFYYAAENPPIDEPILVLNGDKAGPVNNLAVMDRVAPSYAPAGASLVSVTVLGATERADRELDEAIRDQLRHWFGPEVGSWRHLRTYHIPRALPGVAPHYDPRIAPRVRECVYVCGDFCTNGSIDGALRSGRLTAEALLNDR